MKFKKSLLLFLLVAASSAHAATVNRNGTGTELNIGTAWSTGNVPTNVDDATWTAGSVMGAQTVTGPVTWGRIVLTNTTPAGTIDLSGSQITLAGGSLGGSTSVITTGLARDITIANDLVLSGVVNSSATVVGNNTARLQLDANNNANLTLGKVTANGGGTTTDNDANLWLRGAGTNSTINGTLTVDGQLAKADAGIWTLNGANTIGWVFANNGTLRAGNDAAFGTGTIYFGSGGGDTTLSSANGSARNYANALDFTANLGGVAGNGFTGFTANFGQTSGGTGTQSFAGGVNLGTVVRNIATNSNTTFSGVVSGTGGGITKTGTAALILSNANTYTGPTNVNAGTLLVNGNSTLATGALTSLANTTVGGTGTIGAATATINGTLQGGAGAVGQTLTMLGAVTFADNSVIQLTLGAGGTHSTIALNGTETFDPTGGNQAFAFLLSGATAGTTFQDILTGITADPGSLAGWTVNTPGVTGTFAYDSVNQSIDFTLTAVPEPGVALLGGLGLLGLLRRRRA